MTLTSVTNAFPTDPQALGTILDDDGVTEAEVLQAITAGGTRLQDLQNDPGDGGWYFYAGDMTCGAGPGVSCANTFGVTALGLLAAHIRTGDASLLASATAAGDGLVQRYNAAPQSRPFSQDIEFLVDLGQFTGNAVYANTAQAWFQVVVNQFPNAADRVDAQIASRDGQGLRTVAAWDAASFIRAAKAVGNVNYALAAATRIRDREADWKDTDPLHRYDQCPDPQGCGPADNPFAFDFTLLGEGSLLWAFHDLPRFDVQITEYRDFLIAQQDAAGSWDVGDSQITAYVVLGLASVGGAAAEAAIASAASFYIANQMPQGGWPSFANAAGTGPENVEMDGEIVRALAPLFSTAEGESVSVKPAQLSTVTFSHVTSAGMTSVVAIDDGSVAPAPAGFEVVNGLASQVITTAGVSGETTVCFSVPWIEDAATFGHLRVLHQEAGALVDRTILSEGDAGPDFASHRICSEVSSLDPLVIALQDSTPPTVSITLTPPVLWPANHRMVTLAATVDVHDDTDPAPTVTLVSITSSEADDAGGDGAAAGDIQGAAIGADDRSFELRAERSARTTDRTYTVTYRATDHAGNTRDATARVVVPHDESGNDRQECRGRGTSCHVVVSCHVVADTGGRHRVASRHED